MVNDLGANRRLPTQEAVLIFYTAIRRDGGDNARDL